MRYNQTIHFEKPEGMNKYEYMMNLIHEGYYSVDEDGRLHCHLTKKHQRDEIIDKIIDYKNRDGYMIGNIKLKGHRTLELRMHRIVWMIFNGEIPAGMQINHIDGNKRNNNINNIEIVTPSGNIQHALHIIKTIKTRWESPIAKYPKSVYEQIKRDIETGKKAKQGALELNMNKGGYKQIKRRLKKGIEGI